MEDYPIALFHEGREVVAVFVVVDGNMFRVLFLYGIGEYLVTSEEFLSPGDAYAWIEQHMTAQK